MFVIEAHKKSSAIPAWWQKSFLPPLKRDSGQKSLQYRSCPSIQEYLLISSEFPLVEVFRREKQGFWSLYTLGLDDTIELTSLDLRFPVAELYQNTSFLEEANE